MFRATRQFGFTLLELLIVISLLALVAGLIIPNANPGLRDQLQGTAEILAGDIAYARSLAVANGANYRLTFDTTANQYTLQYVGSNTALATLPRSPFSLPSDPTDQQIVRLDKLPHLGSPIHLYAVRALSTIPQAATTLEFGPLGETTRSEETQIWLRAGSGSATRYLSIRVSPITGLTWIENFQTGDPLSPSQSGS
jgi:prepilin-type N-terminal cleavage/methylation domain-containing protein